MITIAIRVENKAKEYMVSKSYAIRSSKFMEAAMARDWKEAHEKRVTILVHEPVSFEG